MRAKKALSTFFQAMLPVSAVGLLVLAGCSRDSISAGALDAAGEEVLAAYTRNNAARAEATGRPRSSRFDRLSEERPAADGADSAPAEAAPEDTSSAPAAEPPPPTAPPAVPRASPFLPEGFLAPLTKGEDRVPVTLEGCLKRALVNNLKVQIARFGPRIARATVAEAEAMFDPSWFLNNALGRLRQDSGTALAGAATLTRRQWDFETGAEALLPTGATVSLAQEWTFLESNSTFLAPNPQYATEMFLEVTQPLLRGAGVEVTRSPIAVARLDHRISLADFKVRLTDTLLETEETYWQLVVAQGSVRALTEALGAARENLRIARLRFEQGKDRRVIVSLAESAVTSRQADLVAARLQLAQTSDRLKRLINDPDLPLEDPAILTTAEQPIAEPIPVTRAVLQRSMLAAMEHRPEMEQSDARLDKLGLLERVARNERLPRLDLEGRYGITGLDSKTLRAMHEQFGTEFFEWRVGLDFEVPIGNRAREAAYRRARLERARALAEREDTRQRVLLDVSDAVRNLAAAEESIQAARAAREAAEQTLADQQANVGAGAALQKDLLEAQRDLADAKVHEIQARAAYMTGRAALEHAKGTLLEYNDMEIIGEGEEDARP